MGQFAFAGLVALVTLGFATAIASRRIGEREAIAQARTTTVIKAQGVVEPSLPDRLLPNDAATQARLDRIVRSDVLDQTLVRVKLWARDGTIVYSDEARLLGQRFPLGTEERESLVSGKINAEVSDLNKAENRYEREFDSLLEVYLPVRTAGGETLLFEAYYRFSLVEDNGSRLWRSFAPFSLGALVALQLVQIPLAWSLARRLRRRMRDRAALLQRALDASEVERRQIASDLHDGAVQELVGVAYELSAAARGAGGQSDADARRVMEQASDRLRESVRSLRSLVVDIYPPNFDDATLESALTDLLARATEQGLEVSLDVSPSAEDLPDATARLLYRAAQEGVRNVLRHARARRVVVTVDRRDRRVTLEVHDDGVGFDSARRTAAVQGGHVGLATLAGLVSDASGTLTSRSHPGEGTTLRVEIPE